MPRRHHLQTALSGDGFRRLWTVRVASQFGDGVFQASLAGAVLFDPERQAGAAAIAAGFAVLLLPYSVIGPFVGVLLDRWSRQRVLALTNALRAVGVVGIAAEIAAGVSGPAFYASALVLLSAGRFVLAALSAAQPRVVPAAELVTANAFATTCGTIAAALGGGGAIGLRAAIGDANADYALIALCAAVPYLVAAAVAAGFARRALGPTEEEQRHRETVAQIARGLVDGARHVYRRRAVFDGLAAITLQRVGYGVTTVCLLLLYRNEFHADGVFRSGLGGLSQQVVAVAVGGGAAAFATPVLFRSLGAVRWPVATLVGCAVVSATLLLSYSPPLYLLAGLLLGFFSQSIKICVDTLVQQQIDDRYRGRVFSVYDTLFNVSLVLAAVIVWATLPASGRSPVSVLVLAAGYLVTGIGYALLGGRDRPPAVTTAQPTTAAAR